MKPCLTCGRPSKGTYCPRHGPPDNHNAKYGKAHRERRAELLPHAIGQPCPRCGDTMTADQALDLDHSTPWVGDRIAHMTCNRGKRELLA